MNQMTNLTVVPLLTRLQKWSAMTVKYSWESIDSPSINSCHSFEPKIYFIIGNSTKTNNVPILGPIGFIVKSASFASRAGIKSTD